MKREILVVFVAVLVLFSSPLFATGAKEAGGEEGSMAAEGEPQYGGTLTTFFVQAGHGEPGSPDIADGLTNPVYWLGHCQEKPLVGDFEKYGPRGNGEYTFQLIGYIPEKYLKGNLIESWEVSPEKVVWHVRPGIMWHGDKPHVMQARELTAEDIVLDLLRYRESPAGSGMGFAGFSGDIYSTSKYDLTIEFKQFDIGWVFLVGYEDRSIVSPPETHAAGGDVWMNQVGTGPFMLEEYEIGSHMSFVKNPNWWKTTVIDGKEYKLPFVDKVTVPIIPDEATHAAALRTGKIDWHQWVDVEFHADLDRTAPELLSNRDPVGFSTGLWFNTASGPFADVRLRQAILMGTDLEAFGRMFGKKVEKLRYPFESANRTVFTPLAELPEDIRVLYDYNPEGARKLLDELGIPRGFKMNVVVNDDHPGLDVASLFAEQMEKIGIEAELDVQEIAIQRGNNLKGAFLHMSGDSIGTANPVEALRQLTTGQYFNFSHTSIPALDEMVARILQESDFAERDRLCKEAGLIALRQIPGIPLVPSLQGVFWWPWLKNYYGERYVQDQDYINTIAHAWLDQDLKKEMGY
jgi:peptide/nickel transport system substrate-binding protein